MSDTAAISGTIPTRAHATDDKAVPHSKRRTPGGVADVSGSGVTQSPAVPRERKTAEHYSKELGETFRNKCSGYGDKKAVVRAIQDAVISALGADPADPKFDLKKFYPNDAEVAAVTRKLYETYKLPHVNLKNDQDISIACLAAPLDQFRTQLALGPLDEIRDRYASATSQQRKDLRHSPAVQSALRNAASWAATPYLTHDPDKREDIVRNGLQIARDLPRDLQQDFDRYFKAMQPKQ